MRHPILVTGAAGRIGGVGGLVVEALRRRALPVRALVRRDDERVEALRARDAYVGRALAVLHARLHVFHRTRRVSCIGPSSLGQTRFKLIGLR